MKRTVFDLMKQLDMRTIPTIDHRANVEEALKQLAKTDSGALLVMSGQTVMGIFSERDFARAYAARRGDLPLSASLEQLTKKRVVYVTGDYRLDECMAVMVKMRVRHLPIMDGDTPIGLLSMRHIMEALADENQFMVGQLLMYITGSNIVEPPVLRMGKIAPAILRPTHDLAAKG